MCGICGIVSTNRDVAPSRARLEAMRDSMTHRGPDAAGLYIEAGVGLGHRRLSIVDVEHGQQPMFSDNRRFVVVYNGEMFNHPSLKPQLEASGVHYRTRSDTETLLHLFERYGEKAVDHMRGMFAFAVWDTVERKLVLGRDRFGVKPLYYLHQSDGSLLFASEIKGLLAATDSSPKLNLSALPDFLANHATSGEETLVAGVRRLAPGHTMVWQDGSISTRRYWDLQYGAQVATSQPNPADEAALVTEFTNRFTEAVRIRLMSDVPLGMFLSGGIDSAAITAVMAGLVTDPIRTFSVAFSEREANELAYARMVASAFRTDHREVVVSPQQFFAALPRLIWHEDEPMAHPSSVALYFVSKLASQHVKVVLTGEGSDEMLAGYNRYRVTNFNARFGALYERLLPRLARRAIVRTIAGLPRTSRIAQRVSRTFLTRGTDLDSLYFDNFAVFARLDQRALLTKKIQAHIGDVDPYVAFHAALDRVRDRPLVSQLLYADVNTYLHELLMKQDQMSMAASIESRVPFLDHPLAEWIANLPQSMKLRGTTTKWILRAAMKHRLPAAIIDRPKMGFPVPIGAWLRGAWRPLLDEYLLGDRALDRGLFEPNAVKALIAEHLAGYNHSERLWALLTFEIWARITLDGNSPWTLELPTMRAAA
jgi:asparagine synthase (glutamine-hydrolysing)